MASQKHPNLPLDYDWNLGEPFKAGMDDNFRLLGAVVQLSVKSRTSNEPGTPAEGDRYIHNGDASWSVGNADDVVVYLDGAWRAYGPLLGWWAYVEDEQVYLGYDGGWNPASAAWGSITGTLSAQTDLQNALDAKLSLDGSLAMAGALDLGSHKAVNALDPTDPQDLVTKGYADGLINGLSWQSPVLAQQNSPPGSFSAGDRYLVGPAPTGDWSGHGDEIAESDDGATWTFYAPSEAWAVNVEGTNLAGRSDVAMQYSGSAWVNFGSAVHHGSLQGLQGGTSGEYYHLTSAQYTSVGNIVSAGYAEAMDQAVDRGASPVFTGAVQINGGGASLIFGTDQNGLIKYPREIWLREAAWDSGDYMNTRTAGAPPDEWWGLKWHDESAATDTWKLRVYASGKVNIPEGYVGIGTDNPVQPLHILKSNAALLKLESQGNDIAGHVIRNKVGDEWNVEIGRAGTDSFSVFHGNGGATPFIIDGNDRVGMPNLPASDPAVAGLLWVDSNNFVKQSTG